MQDKQLEEIGRFVAKSRAETLAVAGSEVQRSIERLREELDEDRTKLLQRVSELAENYNASLVEIDSKRNAEHLEEIQKLTEQIRGQEVFEAQLTERLASIKDGEKGEQGEQGLAGEDGLDRPLVEPVDLIAEKNYPKNTLGTHQGGLWISTKQTLGDPQDDPHSWHCILDAMTTLSVDLQEDHTFLMSVRTATGKTIDSRFEIPFPQHLGIYDKDITYSTGQIVTKGSNMWQAMEDTNGCPPGNGWKQILSAPRGRAGKDGKEGPQGKQGVPGRNGVDAVLPPNFVEDIYELATKVFEDNRSGSQAVTSYRGFFHPAESYTPGDLVNHDGNLYLCNVANSSGRFIDRATNFTLVLGVPKYEQVRYMDWKGDWVQQKYGRQAVVRDGAWTMVALSETTDRPAPHNIGYPLYIYDGILSAQSAPTATQVIVGNRYTVGDEAGQIIKFRIDTTINYRYQVFSVTDPLTNPFVTELYDFVATSTGWTEFNFLSKILLQGTQFDLVAVITDPGQAPTDTVASYNYQTPTNPQTINAGEIIQPGNDPGQMWVSKTDNDATDRSAALEALKVGDLITDAIVNWTIQSVVDNGTWMDFGVTPSTQSAEGVKPFTFSSIPAATIPYSDDADYWTNQGLPYEGLFAIDKSYGEITPDNTAYGVDVQFQAMGKSPDWDVLAYNSGINAGATQVNEGQLTVEEQRWVSASSSPLRQGAAVTTGAAWTEVGRATVDEGSALKFIFSVDAKRLDAVDYHSSEWVALTWNEGGNLTANLQKEVEIGADLSVSLDTDGIDLVIRVKGKPNQAWDWKMIAYYRELH